MTWLYLSEKSAEDQKWSHVNKTIRKEYEKLGSFRFPEVVLLGMGLLLIFLWLFRELEGIDGWAEVSFKILTCLDKLQLRIKPFIRFRKF